MWAEDCIKNINVASVSNNMHEMYNYKGRCDLHSLYMRSSPDYCVGVGIQTGVTVRQNLWAEV